MSTLKSQKNSRKIGKPKSQKNFTKIGKAKIHRKILQNGVTKLTENSKIPLAIGPAFIVCLVTLRLLTRTSYGTNIPSTMVKKRTKPQSRKTE